jgi:hypothetical protein
MTKAEHYRQILSTLDDWDSFLLQESGLPGPRGNLELAQVVADEGDEVLFRLYLNYGPDIAPTNSPYEFLAFCGVVGLGRLLAEGKQELLPLIRQYASDPRWRTREGVAMALQRWGEQDMAALIQEMWTWSRGNRLEQRAAAAALCEPKLLQNPQRVKEVLQILDQITVSLSSGDDRRSEAFKALRKGLGYCWSVAAAAYPEAGKPWLEKWFTSDDIDVRWVMKENLKKNRLTRMDAAWVDKWRVELD